MWQRTGGLLEINQNYSKLRLHAKLLRSCMAFLTPGLPQSARVWLSRAGQWHKNRVYKWINEYKSQKSNGSAFDESTASRVGIGRKQISRSWKIGSTKIIWYSLISARQSYSSVSKSFATLVNLALCWCPSNLAQPCSAPILCKCTTETAPWPAHSLCGIRPWSRQRTLRLLEILRNAILENAECPSSAKLLGASGECSA